MIRKKISNEEIKDPKGCKPWMNDILDLFLEEASGALDLFYTLGYVFLPLPR